MKSSAAVVIPVHKQILSAYEKMALEQCFRIFVNYPVILVAPENLNLVNYYNIGKFNKTVTFANSNFSNKRKYDHMMLSSFFYKSFFDYKYILIYQLDSFVFSDQLPYWCEKGYSYIGGPWKEPRTYYLGKHIPLLPKKAFKIQLQVGNGGLSLRKVKDCYRVSWLYEKIFCFKPLDEDVLWAAAGRFIPGFKIPTVESAAFFALDENPLEIYEQFGSQKPFGCHAWMKYDHDFWISFFQKEGFEIKEIISSVNS